MKKRMDNKRKSKIRAERSGPVEPLTPRMVKFIEERLGGISLDKDGDVEKRPDFACLKGLLAIELKSLETDPKERLENALEAEKVSAEWPMFFGTWPSDSILKHLSNSDTLRKKLLDRLGRALVTHVKKANDQLGHHAARVQRQNLVRLLILLNEDHSEYAPDVVCYSVQRELKRKNKDGSYRNDQIDAVIYLTDRHVASGSKDALLPAIAIFGFGLNEQPWKEDVINLVLARWAAWNGVPILRDEKVSVESFVSAEHVPDKMARHELWALQYRRKPYMRLWNNEDLRNLWDHIILLSLLWGHRDTPMKVPEDGFLQAMERFTHVREEAAVRGLSLEYFEKEPVFRRRQVVEKMPYGPVVAKWLHEVLDCGGSPDDSAVG